MDKRLREKKAADNGRTITIPQVQTLTPPSGLFDAQASGGKGNYRSEVTILRAVSARDLPGFKLNARTVRFDAGDVAAWLAACAGEIESPASERPGRS